MVLVFFFISADRLDRSQRLGISSREYCNLMVQMLIDCVLDSRSAYPDSPLSQNCSERSQQPAPDHPQRQRVAWANAACLQERIECLKVTQFVFEHSAQIIDAARMKNPRNGNLTTVDANGAALTRMVNAKNLLDGLYSTHSCSYAEGYE
jgi:hypothetical protein